MTPPPADTPRGLLVYPTSPLPPAAPSPDETLAWVIRLRPTRKGATFQAAEIARTFDAEWTDALLPGGTVTLYGQRPGQTGWIHLGEELGDDDADDGQAGFSSVALAVALRDVRGKAPSEKALAALAEAAREDAADLGGLLSFRENPREAVARAKEALITYRSMGDVTLSFLLVAPDTTPFEGRALVDALFEHGLVIDDDGVFHWENTPDRPGDRSLFRVATTTPPECFLEDDLENGHLYENAVFELDIARTAEPRAILDVALAVATSLQRHLGGDLLNDEGSLLDPRVLRARTDTIAARLTDAGFTPGGAAALALF